MKQAFNDVRDFHRRFGAPSSSQLAFPSMERIQLRRSLIAEEMREFMHGMASFDMMETADGLGDLIYVLIGTAIEFGIPLPAIWDEIQRSNMSKLEKPDHNDGCALAVGNPASPQRCTCGAVLYRPGGKVLKGSNYRPPDIEAILRPLGWTPLDERLPDKADKNERNK